MVKENRKDFYVSAVRHYLQKLGVSYTTYEAPSGSVYFHLEVDNRHSHPCIRVADHPENSFKGHALTFLYTASKNAKTKDIRRRIERSIDNMLKRTRTYSTYKCIQEL